MFFNVPGRGPGTNFNGKNIYDTTATTAAADRLETRRRGVTAAGSQPRQTAAFVFLARLYDFIYYYYYTFLLYNIHRDDGFGENENTKKKEINEKKKRATSTSLYLFIFSGQKKIRRYVQIELISTHEKRFGRRPPFFLYILFQFLH